MSLQMFVKFGFFIFAAFFVPVSAQRPCFSGGSIAGAVIGTFIATLAAVALVFLFWKFYWKRRRARKLCLETHRDAEKAEPYAFDNPGFLPEDPRSGKKDAAGNIFHKGTNDKDAKIDSKSGQPLKKTAWSPLSVFSGNHRQEKRRTVDDSCLGEAQRTLVSLRGHDFTGLGFDVSGNMRDGIFVKDVLHRGPAAESGKIASGDRIMSLNVSFRHMVFEDALTILSYASPYEVTLELERPAVTTTVPMAVASSSERLCHPFFRSQSIDDLTEIGKASRQARHGIATQTKARKVRSLDIPEEVTSDASRQSPGKVDVRHTQAAPENAATSDVKSKAIVKPERTKKPKDAKEASIDTVDVPKESDEKGKPKEKEEKEKFRFPKFGIRVLPDMHVKDKDIKDKDNNTDKEAHTKEKVASAKGAKDNELSAKGAKDNELSAKGAKDKELGAKDKDSKSNTDKFTVVAVTKDVKEEFKEKELKKKEDAKAMSSSSKEIKLPKEKETKKKDEVKTVPASSKDVVGCVSEDGVDHKEQIKHKGKGEFNAHTATNPHGHSTAEMKPHDVDEPETNDADGKKKAHKSHLGIKLPKISGGIHLFDSKSSAHKHKRESSESEAETGKPEDVESVPAADSNKPAAKEVQKENGKSSEDEDVANEEGHQKLHELEEKNSKEKVGLIPKGLKNLKEWKDKIQGDFHRKKRDSTSSNKDDADDHKESSEEGDIELSPETRKKKKKTKKKPKGTQELALDIPEEVLSAGMAAKTNRKSGIPTQGTVDAVENNPAVEEIKIDSRTTARENAALSHTSSSDDENQFSSPSKSGETGMKTSPKRSMKRKAPMPPNPLTGSPTSNSADEVDKKHVYVAGVTSSESMDIQHNETLEFDKVPAENHGEKNSDKKEEYASKQKMGSDASNSSDSETEANTEIKKIKKGGTTIELNSNQITIHHSPTPGDEIDATPTESEVEHSSIPDSGENIAQASSSSTRGAPTRSDESGRKAASLGDLSKIEGENKMSVPLERAMSLDLGNAEDPTSGQLSNKKRKAPLPPSEDLSAIPDGEERTLMKMEAKLDTDTFGKRLKKSSDWGTLEEAMRVPSEDQDEKHFESFIHFKENDPLKTVLLVVPETTDTSSVPSTSEINDNSQPSVVIVNARKEIGIEAVQSPLITSSEMGVSVHVTSSTHDDKDINIVRPDSSHVQQVTTSGAELHEEIDSTTPVTHATTSSEEVPRSMVKHLVTGNKMKETEDDSSESEPPDLPTSPVPRVSKYPATTSYHSTTTYVTALPYTPPKSHITEIQVITSSSARDETESSEDERMDEKGEAIYENMQIIKQHQQKQHFTSNNGGISVHDVKESDLKSSPSDSSLSSRSDIEDDVDKSVSIPRPTVHVVNATEKKKISPNVSTFTTGTRNITVMSINTDNKTNAVQAVSENSMSPVESQLTVGGTNAAGTRRSASPHRDVSSTVKVEVAGFSNGRSKADQGKEVIQISSEELDGIMMSHSQFLTQKARHMATQPAGYEQWIYLDNNGETRQVQSASGSDSGNEHAADSRNGLQEHHTDRDSSEIIVTENATLPLGPVHSAVVTLPTKSVTQIIVDPDQGTYTVNEGSVSKSVIISNLQLAADRRSPETPVPKLEPPQ